METKTKYAKLAQQIKDGQKDEHLDTLQCNAERVICYEVWKAVDERRKQIRLEKKGIAEEPYTAPEVAGWIKVGAHTSLDIECIESVGRLLDRVRCAYPFIDDVETFDKGHIRCRSLNVDVGLALTEAHTELGSEGHNVRFTAGIDAGGIPYWNVQVQAAKKVPVYVKYDTEEEAILSTFEVIEDECLL